jgi:pilus assembly protein CpaB
MAARKYTVVFYLALLVAVGATYGVYRVIDATKRGSQIATRPVVLASDNIPEGSAIDGLLRVERWPEPVVPDSAYGDVAILKGRVARVPIFAGEAIVPGRLAPEGTSPGLEAKITPGKRAMGLRIDDVAGMSGMIQPNSRVDVLLTLDSQNQKTAKLFMPNMRVLAMGTEVQRNEKGEPIPTTVATVEVTPDESEKLAVAASQGRIALVLRGYSDPETVKTRGATTSDVVAALRDFVPPPVVSRPPPRTAARAKEPEPAPVQAPPVTAPPPTVVQRPETTVIPVFRGRTKSEEKFRKDSVRRDTIPN